MQRNDDSNVYCGAKESSFRRRIALLDGWWKYPFWFPKSTAPPIHRPMSNMIVETLPSPITAMMFQRTASSALSLHCSVTDITEDISKGLPDDENGSGSTSFILDTMTKENEDMDGVDEKARQLHVQVESLTRKESYSYGSR